MPKYRVVLVLTCFTLLSYTVKENSHDQISVTYIANEGFMIQSGSDKILIDAVFYDENINFCDVPSKELISKIENASAPFDDVDVIFVTHNHLDHFSSIPLYNHLLSNSQCKLLCPSQVFEKLKNDCPDISKIKDQIISISLGLNNFEDIIVNNIPVKLIRLHHSIYMEKDEKTGEMVNRHRNVENFGYIIDLGNKKIFHVGDASLKDNNEGIKKIIMKMNLVFIEWWEITGESQTILTDNFDPDEIIYMHFDVKTRADKEKLVRAYVKDAVIFSKEMEEKSFK